jgi:hypothetical protein
LARQQPQSDPQSAPNAARYGCGGKRETERLWHQPAAKRKWHKRLLVWFLQPKPEIQQTTPLPPSHLACRKVEKVIFAEHLSDRRRTRTSEVYRLAATASFALYTSPSIVCLRATPIPIILPCGGCRHHLLSLDHLSASAPSRLFDWVI